MRRSLTRSSTLLRCLLSSSCFSSVDSVAAERVPPLPARLRLVPVPVAAEKAPASLLGLRCSMAGTESRWLPLPGARGMDGVSGMR